MLCHLRRPARVLSLFRTLPAVPLSSAAPGEKCLFFDMVSLSLSLARSPPLLCVVPHPGDVSVKLRLTGLIGRRCTPTMLPESAYGCR